MSLQLGWFADRGEDHGASADAPWMAFVQVRHGCHALDGIWFTTEDDCWSFIVTDLAGLGVLDDPRA